MIILKAHIEIQLMQIAKVEFCLYTHKEETRTGKQRIEQCGKRILKSNSSSRGIR